MTSLYDILFDDIPMFVVPGTESSSVIEYETNEQRTVRLINEAKVKQKLEEIRRLEIQLLQVKFIGPWRQKRLPESTQYDWVEDLEVTL